MYVSSVIRCKNNLLHLQSAGVEDKIKIERKKKRKTLKIGVFFLFYSPICSLKKVKIKTNI